MGVCMPEATGMCRYKLFIWYFRGVVQGGVICLVFSELFFALLKAVVFCY